MSRVGGGFDVNSTDSLIVITAAENTQQKKTAEIPTSNGQFLPR
jgi:hypothetical protein